MAELGQVEVEAKYMAYVAKVYASKEEGMTPWDWQELSKSRPLEPFKKSGKWWQKIFKKAYDLAMQKFLCGHKLSPLEVTLIKAVAGEQMYNFD